MLQGMAQQARPRLRMLLLLASQVAEEAAMNSPYSYRRDDLDVLRGAAIAALLSLIFWIPFLWWAFA